MEFLLILVLVFMLGFKIGYGFYEFKINLLINKLTKPANVETLESNIMSQVVVHPVASLYTEKVGESFLLFDEDTHTFVCQATTIEDLAKLCQLHNNISYATVTHNNKVLMFVDGVIMDNV